MDDAGEIAGSLSVGERAVIRVMSCGELVLTVAQTAADAGIPLTETRRILASFRERGWAVYGPLWNEDENRPAGSGNWLSPLGLAVRAILQKDQ